MSERDNGQPDPNSRNGNSPDAAGEQPLSTERLAAQAERSVLNACLDEVLGGVTPPDLAPQILARIAQSQANGVELKNGNGLASSVDRAINGSSLNQHSVNSSLNGVSQPAAGGNRQNGYEQVQAAKSDSTNGSSGRHRSAPATKNPATANPQEGGTSSRRGWIVVIAASAACLLLAFLTYLNWQSVFGDQRLPGDNVANQNPSDQNGGNQAEQGGAQDADRGRGSNQQNLADNGSSLPGGTPADRNGTELANGSEPDRPLPRDAGGTANDRNSVIPTVPVRPVSAVVSAIDASLARRWQEEDVTPAAWATDAEWCRRVYLDVLGRIPTVDESVEFVTSSDATKKEQLVDRLLYASEYQTELADHWANVWTNVLIGREGGTEPRSVVSREGLHQYLAEAIGQNKPYDQMVMDLVTATGTNRPGTPGFNGAVNFLLDNMDHDATSATAKTAQIFLARQIQCAQCHNHPFYDEPQRQFWELNAFFRQARVVPAGGRRNGQAGEANAQARRGLARLVDRDFRGEGNRNPAEAEIYYERANGLLEMAFPKFLDGTAIDPAGQLAAVNRRQELASMIVASPWMSEAIVNRMWGYFLGVGFARPLDDLGPHQNISHPELLQELAGEFRANGHDLRKLMKWIVLSQPYSLSSEVPASDAAKDQPYLAGGPLFSRFYSRQLSPEAVYDSLLVAAGQHGARDTAAQDRQRQLWLGQFTLELENDENREVDLFDGAIPQALEMWNGELTSKALSLQDQGMLASIAGSEMSDPEKIKHLFLSALSREPTAAEMRLVRGMLREAGSAGLPQVLQDVYWSLLNSSEFILQH